MITAAAFLAAAALGAIFRALAGQHLNRPGGFAVGTLAVNLVGSFLLGLLHNVAPPAATVLGVGFLGALTTYSSFTGDAVALVELRKLALAGGYVVVTVGGSLIAAFAGMQIVS